LSDGYVWAGEFDTVIVNFSRSIGIALRIDVFLTGYQSFDEDKLPSLLPLPKEVTDHVILSRYLNLSSGFNSIGNSLGDDQVNSTLIGKLGDFVVPRTSYFRPILRFHRVISPLSEPEASGESLGPQ